MKLIDADALMDDIRKHSESYFADDFAHIWVDKQPTVEAEPVRHGKWVEAGRGVVCSCCGKAYTLAETNYCWECGAKMDKQEKHNG